MTHRERILTALDHKTPDRLPMDIGSARFTGIVEGAYENLRAHLKFGKRGPIIERMMQVVDMDEAVLEYSMSMFALSARERPTVAGWRS